jgi:hypothetical protein
MPRQANAVILDPGRPIRERLEAAARQWVESGRGSDALLTGSAYFMARCWLNSRSGTRLENDNVSQNARDFIAAGKAALGGETGWNSLLAQRESCRECNMPFRLENLGICTACAEYVCGACRRKHTGCAGEVVG